MNLPRYVLINLTSGLIQPYHIDMDTAVLYLGGKGLAARLLYDLNIPGIDALSPDNHLIINTSPVTGTGAPCTSRFNASTKSPLTGGIASSNCGGPFGIMLRKAGYDGLIITGRAEYPSLIEIIDGEAVIKDARHLWGLDTERTQHEIGSLYQALVIGPAGENLVRYACALSGERALGRCGIGTVMGSKNLKAIVTYGTQPPPVSDRPGLKQYTKKWVSLLKNNQSTGIDLPRYGTAGFVRRVNNGNIFPTHNYKFTHYREADKICGEELADNLLVGNSGCISCPIRCERRIKLDEKEIKGPEFETIGLLGANIENSSLTKISSWNYLADKLGMDTISLAGTLAFAMELQERGIKDFGLCFGDHVLIAETIKKIAYREGVGNELADGTRILAERYGGSDFAIHSKGLELAAYDPRQSQGLGLGYATANRGGCHLNAGYMVYMEVTGPINLNPLISTGKPEITVLFQNALEAISTSGFCLFTSFALMPNLAHQISGKLPAKLIAYALTTSRQLIAKAAITPGLLPFNSRYIFAQAEAIKLVTGLPITTGKFLEAGERSYNMERLFNLREGFTSQDDSLPLRLTAEHSDPDNPKSVVNLSVMVPRYYQVRGWDKKGQPTEKTLRRLRISI